MVEYNEGWDEIVSHLLDDVGMKSLKHEIVCSDIVNGTFSAVDKDFAIFNNGFKVQYNTTFTYVYPADDYDSLLSVSKDTWGKFHQQVKILEAVDEKEAEKAARKMQKGQFSFDDFLKQLNMLRKMGPLKKVLGMLPGVGSMLKDFDFDNKEFGQMEAIMLSMTPRERRNPDCIDIQRRRRIARGSGNGLDRVNALMKQFKMMQKMMKSLGRGGLPGMPDLGGMEGMSGMPGMPGLPGAGVPSRRRPPRGGGGLQGYLGGGRKR